MGQFCNAHGPKSFIRQNHKKPHSRNAIPARLCGSAQALLLSGSRWKPPCCTVQAGRRGGFYEPNCAFLLVPNFALALFLAPPLAQNVQSVAPLARCVRFRLDRPMSAQSCHIPHRMRQTAARQRSSTRLAYANSPTMRNQAHFFLARGSRGE